MIKIIFNTIVGLVLIFIWSRFVDLTQIWQKLSEANLIFLLPAFFCMFASPFIRAIRLKVFLSEIKQIPLWNLVFLNGAAILLNFFIPIRAGDFGKGVYLNTKYELSFGKSIIWVFMDRFIDFLTVLAASSIFLLVIPTTLPKNFIIIISSVFCLFLLVTYLAIFRLDFSKKLVVFLTPLFIFNLIKIPFVRFTSFILESFSILKRSKKDLMTLIVLTLLAYVADAGIWFFTFQSLGVNPGYLTMYFGQMLSALTYLIPAAPGYVGSAEVSGSLILSGVFGFEVNVASSMVVLSHITTAIFVIILGLISIFNLKLDLNLILKKALRRK
ncbi:flippase-like domain-containing protein [Candidatus Daviesbacteria bacterium]|nr:flippase-like domain-containing protein [Candidatus Daviesbacteria bacterium]